MSRCTTCDVTFESTEAFSRHYNSEWHLANVRRRVESVRPLTVAEFSQVHKARQDEAEATGIDANGAPVYSCTLCRKTFRSVQTLQTHVRSTAHLMRKEQRIIQRDSEAASMLTMTSLGSAAMGLHRRNKAKRAALKKGNVHQRSDVPQVSLEDRDADADETRCFFCGHPSTSMDANLLHMLKSHHFTIPMDTHCHDVVGLLAYLSRKVNGLMCLVCGEKTRSFASLDALRDHMREANHERIVLNPEYQEFYDCLLEDPDSVQPVKLDGLQAQGTELVLSSADSKNDTGSRDAGAGGKKRVLLKREAEVPRPRPRETFEQKEQRKAILASEHEALTVARQEQRELMAEHHRAEAKQLRRSDGAFQQLQLRVNLRSNKLHPKGYDGDGVMN